MIKKITDQKLVDEISDIYGNAGEKGIDINNAKTAGLFLTTDDLEAGDIRFGHRIEHNDLSSLRESDEKIEKNAMISCLNYGFVEIQDWMGSDSDIIAAARTSYAGKRSSADGALLRYLLRHQHTTPFECTALKFRIYMPIVVYRQFFRHRTASQMEPEFISNDSAFQKFSVQNEMSGRYVELPDHFYIPEDRRLQFQSKENRQGSAGQLQEEDRLTARHHINNALKACRHAYQELLRLGVARETARNVLPLTQYTLLIWKIDLKNLLHFLSLRLDPHAQWEVREYAKAIADVVSCLFPETWSAFLDYQLGGIRFSKDEMASMAGQWSMDDVEAMIGEFAKKTSNIREREEFKQKLMRYYGA